MYAIFFLVSFFFVSNVYATVEYCHSDAVGACSPVGGGIENCNAKYGGAGQVLKELQNFVNLQLSYNWKYLLLSTHFANYEVERPGFAKLFRKYSDKLWEDAQTVAKYITKRGGVMDFAYKKALQKQADIESYDVTELVSLAKSLDLWKTIAEEAHVIHGEVTRRRDGLHDPEVSSFIENEFVHEHAKIIRDLAGHTNDVKKLMENSADANVAIWFFDNYLTKLQ